MNSGINNPTGLNHIRGRSRASCAHGTCASLHGGFTLIEVLIALAVLAIALSAVIKGVGANANNAAHLRDRMLAHWVAMNKVTELQTNTAFPTPGVTTGTMLMAEHEWTWQVTVSTTPNATIQRLDVEVRSKKEDKQPLDSLIAYAGQPQ